MCRIGDGHAIVVSRHGNRDNYSATKIALPSGPCHIRWPREFRLVIRQTRGGGIFRFQCLTIVNTNLGVSARKSETRYTCTRINYRFNAESTFRIINNLLLNLNLIVRAGVFERARISP